MTIIAVVITGNRDQPAVCIKLLRLYCVFVRNSLILITLHDQNIACIPCNFILHMNRLGDARIVSVQHEIALVQLVRDVFRIIRKSQNRSLPCKVRNHPRRRHRNGRFDIIPAHSGDQHHKQSALRVPAEI